MGTNIDPRSLLSTDYFNTFNSVVMVLDLLPDAPDLLEEVEQWQFYDYIGHFQRSGLDFAQLAIETMERVLPWYTVASTSSLPVLTGLDGTHQPSMRVSAMPF